MPADKRQRGDSIEAIVREHLLTQGLREIARNANYRVGEIDLVFLDAQARSGPTLVFVEVRYRHDAAYGGGAMSVDVRKQRKLIRAAEAFLQTHPQHAQMACRFDVVDASGDPASPRLDWIRDAFRADDV